MRTLRRACPMGATALERIFEFLRQVFDVVWWPVFDVHAEVQTHAGQHFFDLVQGFAAEVWCTQHFCFGLPNEITDIHYIVVLQAVCRADGQLKLVNLLQQKRVELQTIVFVLRPAASGSSKLTKMDSWSCRMRAANATASSGVMEPSVSIFMVSLS